jgi:hypothetical protein
MSIARKLLADNESYRFLDSQTYKASENAHIARSGIIHQINDLMTNLQLGIAQFDTKRLFVEGMSFLYIDLAHEVRNYDMPSEKEETVLVEAITMKVIDNALIGEGSSGARYAIGDATARRSYSGADTRTIRDLMEDAQIWKWKCIFLPLDVPASLAHHRILHRLAAAARQIVAGENETFERYKLAKSLHTGASKVSWAALLKLSDQFGKLPKPAAVSDALMRDIATMDWTFDYADRPSSAMYDQKARILKGIKAMDIDSAACALGNGSRGQTYALTYLFLHPDYERVTSTGVAKAA